MTRAKLLFSGLSESNDKATRLCARWHLLCERFLPVKSEDSIWRFNRDSKPQEPLQGWKLHISATILEACDLFEQIVPFLIAEDVQFKAPKFLEELAKLNCGLQYGYQQVGKFITIYPLTETQAVKIAGRLHELTKNFSAISIPYDEQYLPDSCVFYRYGAFSKIEKTDENGKVFLAIRNQAEEFVPDNRFQAVPEWASNPFQNKAKIAKKTFAGTPLGTTYKIFRAIKQRGKGGIYQAIDVEKARLCIVKEGRRNGELGWNGQDGYFLVKNEFEVLSILREKYAAVPQVFDSFEIFGNFYFAMEYIEGKNLYEIMKPRKRRFCIRQILKLAIEIAKIIENIHQAGWVWNDCKPANLIFTENQSLRPIDFEGSYPTKHNEPIDWKTEGFSKSVVNGKAADVYALGAVVYFMLTGIFYEADKPERIKKLRRRVPLPLIEVTEKLLTASDIKVSEAQKEFEKLLDSVCINSKD